LKEYYFNRRKIFRLHTMVYVLRLCNYFHLYTNRLVAQ